MLIQTPKQLEVMLLTQIPKEKILVVLAVLFLSPKPSNPSHYLGDMHENDYRNHQAFQA
jgi:hypothetical protein